MAKVIGIDLGTTNSCVAVMDGKEAKVIEMQKEQELPLRWLPSVSQRKVSRTICKRQAVTNPENTLFAIKRLIGRNFEDKIVKDDSGLVPTKLLKVITEMHG